VAVNCGDGEDVGEGAEDGAGGGADLPHAARESSNAKVSKKAARRASLFFLFCIIL
jgi:hypothetical protein